MIAIVHQLAHNTYDVGYWLSLLAFPATLIICIVIAFLSKVVRSSRNSPVLPRARVTRDDRRAVGTSKLRFPDQAGHTRRPSNQASRLNPRRQPRPEPLKATRW